MNNFTREPETLLRAFSERLKRPRPEPDISNQRWSYREAASVLHSFRPSALNPVDPMARAENPYLLLAEDIVPAPGGRAENLHTLKPTVRTVSLRRLKTLERMRGALDCNPDRIHTNLQNMFEACLFGKAIPLDQQSYADLRLTYQVSEWLDGLVPGVPSPSEIQPLMARRSLLASVEHLVLTDFVGREKELQELRDYMGILAPTRSESLRRRLRGIFNLVERPPMLITGPGGIGKSALIGRFLSEHANAPVERRFPFAYLPFDNPSLKITDPFTLLIESVAQFELQYPAAAQAFETFREEVKKYRDVRGQIGDQTIVYSDVKERLEAVRGASEELYESFARLIRAFSPNATELPPALFVLDTFEEVEYRSPLELRGLWEMFGAVQRSYPWIRLIVSGRRISDVIINKNTAIRFLLPPLNTEASESLLKRLGVSDPQVARAVVDQVGGNPLTLHLAARVLESEQATSSGIADLNTRTWYWTSLSEEIIRGQLYRRVLDHIHDEDVRKLAHPGMVLRRLTPPLIQDVLSPICGVTAPDDDTVQHLFEELRKEHALVSLEEDGSLHYRPEIRNPMLKLLTQDKPQEVRAIHEAAVSFYEKFETAEARAEELYHRLMLDEEPQLLMLRWLELAGPLVAHSVDQLPPRAASWLASQMSLNIDYQIRQNAITEQWERQVARSARDAIRYLDSKTALQLLGERKDRSPGSPLYALEARAYLLTRNYSEAARVLDSGIASLPPNPSRGRSIELFWMRAGVAAQQAQVVVSDQCLERAQRIAELITNPLCRVQILTERLVARERWPQITLSDAAPIRARLAEALTLLDESLVDRQRGLVRNAIAYLGPSYPVTFRKILVTAGLGGVLSEPLRQIAFSLTANLPALISIDFSGNPETIALNLLEKSDLDPRVVEGVAALLRQTTGSGSTAIVGIEEYREPWELETGAEVS